MKKSALTTGAMIGGVLGALWLIGNANTPLGAGAAMAFRIAGIAGVVALAAGRRRAEREPAGRDAAPGRAVDLFGRAYWRIVAGEGALLAIGCAAFAAAGAPGEVYRPWTAIVVALHFVAFRRAGVWRGSAIWPVVPLLAVGVAGLALASTSAARWVVLVTGVGTGLILLGGCLFVIAREVVAANRIRAGTADRLAS